MGVVIRLITKGGSYNLLCFILIRVLGLERSSNNIRQKRNNHRYLEMSIGECVFPEDRIMLRLKQEACDYNLGLRFC